MADLIVRDNPKCRSARPPDELHKLDFHVFVHIQRDSRDGQVLIFSPTGAGSQGRRQDRRILREREQAMRVRLMVVGLTAATTIGVPLWLAAAQAAPPQGAKSAPAPKPPAAPAPAVGVGAGAEPTLIGQFGSWGAYSATPGGRKICFALAKPSSSKTNPPNRPRDPAYVFVSTRPAEKVSNEVSVSIGYQLKPGSEGSLEVGSAKYAMYTQGDGSGSRTPPRKRRWSRR